MQPASKSEPSPRIRACEAFVASSPARGARLEMLAGDASFRKYWRAIRGSEQWVVMDAPPEHEDVRPFMQVTDMLLQADLSVPRVLHADAQQGFLLLEDLGDQLFSRYLRVFGGEEGLLYQSACEELSRLQRFSLERPEVIAALPAYDEAVYLREVMLFSDWFLVQVHGRARAETLRDVWRERWRSVLREVSLAQRVLVHRDYHADNLLWRPEAVKRVAMLDYQDALRGDALYDVISLLEDARRDVSKAVVASCRARMLRDLAISDAEFDLRYDVLAAQRNAKIIGIFVRLCVRDGKERYLDYLPRVWAHFLRDLSHPALHTIREFVENEVPATYRGAFDAELSRGGIV